MITDKTFKSLSVKLYATRSRPPPPRLSFSSTAALPSAASHSFFLCLSPDSSAVKNNNRPRIDSASCRLVGIVPLSPTAAIHRARRALRIALLHRQLVMHRAATCTVIRSGRVLFASRSETDTAQRRLIKIKGGGRRG